MMEFPPLTLLLSAMLYGRGRKVLTLWGGSARSSSDSGVRPDKPGDTSLSSWPVLVLLALDNRRELKGRWQRGKREGRLKERKRSEETFHQYLPRTSGGAFISTNVVGFTHFSSRSSLLCCVWV